MGWRGAVRSIGAAMRAAERDAIRREKVEYRQAVADDSFAAVQAWEDFLHKLVNIHTNLADAIDWMTLARAPAPQPPKLGDTRERKARQDLEAFRSNWTDLFRGGSKSMRRKLERELAQAPAGDLEDFQHAKAAYKVAHEEWKTEGELAREVVAGEPAAIRKVLQEMQSAMDGGGFIGTQINYSYEPGYLHAEPLVHGIDIVPTYRRKQLASGRLSETKMPVGEVNERYQDYVASVALKVAGDLFQILPLKDVYVTCVTDMLNQQTGHKESTPILSVHFVRATFENLRLGTLDPSDAMRNFRHAMQFKRSHGFTRVERLTRPRA
jgi:hypothetical protein